VHMAIEILSEETIGKIAAGEVVERPASVVKELLENSIDARATRISIRIEGGGIDLIEVADDGCGMSPGDLSLAFARHATSKVRTFSDLDQLRSLGFRGEALPSIAAVSSCTLRSRTMDDGAGAVMTVDHGRGSILQAVGSPVGTTVTVRDLFGSVPARRKFLRRPSTENLYIQRVLEAYAFANPMIAFSLEIEGRKQLTTPGTGGLIDAAIAVVGIESSSHLKVLEQLEPTVAVPGVEVTGWLGLPSLHRSNRYGMVFFVNGRWIQSRTLSYALEEAYHTLLMVGRHPVAFASIAIDPAEVDVNVHPTKSEVKFRDERVVARAVSRTAHATLAAAPPREAPTIGFSELPRSPKMSQGEIFSTRPELQRRADPVGPLGQRDASQTPSPTRSMPLLRVLGQVASSFIIAEGPEGLYLIDQHAAHERVMYEKLLAAKSDEAPNQQPLLDPLVVELPEDELAVAEQSLGDLQSLGFDVELFGTSSLVIRAVPAVVVGVDVAERIHAILRELVEGGAGTSWLDSVVVSVACHTSIRAGQTLSLPEMRELIEQLERTQQPRACGHGRPTMLKMTQSDLERQFARR
jgi:DNA mismatch repair protein MutL